MCAVFCETSAALINAGELHRPGGSGSGGSMSRRGEDVCFMGECVALCVA